MMKDEFYTANGHELRFLESQRFSFAPLKPSKAEALYSTISPRAEYIFHLSSGLS